MFAASCILNVAPSILAISTVFFSVAGAASALGATLGAWQPTAAGASAGASSSFAGSVAAITACFAGLARRGRVPFLSNAVFAASCILNVAPSMLAILAVFFSVAGAASASGATLGASPPTAAGASTGASSSFAGSVANITPWVAILVLQEGVPFPSIAARCIRNFATANLAVAVSVAEAASASSATRGAWPAAAACAR